MQVKELYDLSARIVSCDYLCIEYIQFMNFVNCVRREYVSKFNIITGVLIHL